MGVNLGLIRDLEIPTVNKLFIHTQPAHLQKLTGMELDTSDRNIERAAYLRRHLSERPAQRRITIEPAGRIAVEFASDDRPLRHRRRRIAPELEIPVRPRTRIEDPGGALS